MSVRKRKWKTGSGEEREAWIVDYFDQAGDRHIETFDRKTRRMPKRPRQASVMSVRKRKWSTRIGRGA